ncbi:MAG: nitric oxide reductase transcriptional regulator NorR [Planctomycetes bacterium]|nr:nitric oxide reductase transcriptional regulator NorR [Planctomycetota bacterium]
MSTTKPKLEDLLPIALDMTAALTAEDRSKRLVATLARALPCDSVALLRAEGEELVPVAAHGLPQEVLGRRFRRSEHPRLDILCRASEPTIFPAESTLPDPFDGLIGSSPHLDVHSCLGCALRIEGRLVGILAADALAPGAFDGIDRRFLTYLAALSAAALRTGDLIEALEGSAQRKGQVARELVRDVLERRGGLLIGAGAAMARLRREIELVAPSLFPVLVTGETGVGKELVVRTLHSQSPRAEEPLVYVNCAALPESVVESELFGHARGAFTGAHEARLGKFRVADGASLFLDEIGELPLHVQPKLLRALQEGEIQPVGTDKPIHVDVRLFAATNRDLDAEVRAGRFRSDLLHRLDVCRIRVPPLREHLEDVPMLAGHFADRARRRLGTGPIRFEPAAIAALARGSWPGNVRELENAISRAILRALARTSAGGRVIVELHDLDAREEPRPAPPASAPHSEARPAPVKPLREAVQDYERSLILDALARSGGSWAAAGRLLGIDRSNLYHLAGRLGLRRELEDRRAADR